MSVSIQTMVDEDAAVAQVTVALPQGYTRQFTGSSKRHPEDSVDPSVGEALAVARAMHKATQDLILWSKQQVHTNGLFDSLFKAPEF